MNAEKAYREAKAAQKRIHELEPIIMQDTGYSFLYARDVVHGRWSEAEPIIMKHGYWAYAYAREIIHMRWREAEEIIIQSALNAYFYARDVIKERWLEAEPTILMIADSAYLYTRDVVQMRWPEAEKIVAQSKYKDDYVQEFFGDELVVTKDEVDIIQWERKNVQGYFAPASWFEDKVSFLDMMVE